MKTIIKTILVPIVAAAISAFAAEKVQVSDTDGSVNKDKQTGYSVKESAGARKSRLALTDLPKPVQDTIMKHSQNDSLPIKGIKIKHDKENGEAVYKVEFQEKGANTKLWVKEDGSLLKQEK